VIRMRVVPFAKRVADGPAVTVKNEVLGPWLRSQATRVSWDRVYGSVASVFIQCSAHGKSFSAPPTVKHQPGRGLPNERVSEKNPVRRYNDE
jgi:hypothetical protein